MQTATVIKRDGRIVSFDRNRILNAVTLAHEAAFKEAYELVVGREFDLKKANVTSTCNTITDAVTERLFDSHENPHFEVEKVQDFVEEELMREGHFNTARLYIKYREKHNQERSFFDSKLPEGALSRYITSSRYARYSEELARRETLPEMVQRVADMHVRKNPQIEEQLRWAFDHVEQQNVLPSMRSLQFGGFPIEEKNARIFNCIAGPVDNIDFFREYMYLLLCGCGVGYAVDYEFIEQLPPIVDQLDEDRITHHTIEDSIEGWAWSVDALIRSFVEGYVVEFNYSNIRPKGAPIRTGGRAPGHVPLRRALDQIRAILDSALGRQLEPIEVFDINCLIADAVLAGGVRRSATICIFSADDLDMRRAKTGDWHKTHPHRARANISVRLLRSEVPERTFRRVFKYLKDWGEPGFYFCNSIYEIPNPCVEITMYCRLEDGSTGFQACNLSTINGGHVTDAEKFYDYARAAAIIGTSQASFTDFDLSIFRPATRALIEREALIGVSMTAILANPQITLDESVVRRAAEVVKETNREIAELIGINAAARTTCVKPEGTSTLQLDLTLSGIHPAHAPHYFRRVTANKKDPVYQWFKEHNPHMCQESVWSKNKTDDVITFPVKAPDHALFRKDIKNVAHLEIVLNWQKWWVETGQGYTTYTNAHNNVSNTVTYDEEHWEDVARFIWEHRQHFTGITLLRYESDKVFPQAPFEEITTPEDRLHYVNLINEYRPVDYTEMVEIQDDTALQREWACAGGSCQIV